MHWYITSETFRFLTDMWSIMNVFKVDTTVYCVRAERAKESIKEKKKRTWQRIVNDEKYFCNVFTV